MNFFDLIRRLVDSGPFASDAERAAACAAVDEHQEHHDALVAAVAHAAPAAASGSYAVPPAGGHPYGEDASAAAAGTDSPADPSQ